MRNGIRRVRQIQRQIDDLNAEKSAVYTSLRQTEVDPALVRKVVYRLGLSENEITDLELRDQKLAAYWRAVADLREVATTDATSDAMASGTDA